MKHENKARSYYSRDTGPSPGRNKSKLGNSLSSVLLIILFDLVIASTIGDITTVIAAGGIICFSLLPIWAHPTSPL